MLMRLAAVSLLMVSFLSAKADGEVLTIEGQYQNKNLYVSNSVTSSGVGFCAYEVRVNGELTTDEVNSSAFEIDLTQLQLKQGDMVTIQIWHRDGCSPKVLNPMVLRPQATFEVTNIELSEDGLLTWKTINESGSLPFNIEVYKWNKWVKVGEVQGKGSAGENAYDFKLTLISGENKVRVTQKGNMGKIAQSKSVFVTSKVEKPSWKLDDSKRKITLSANSAYEIFDKYGQARIRGYGNTIDISSLGSDEYYLCYDNVVENFRKE
jgi:hypothetical protein